MKKVINDVGPLNCMPLTYVAMHTLMLGDMIDSALTDPPRLNGPVGRMGILEFWVYSIMVRYLCRPQMRSTASRILDIGQKCGFYERIPPPSPPPTVQWGQKKLGVTLRNIFSVVFTNFEFVKLVSVIGR